MNLIKKRSHWTCHGSIYRCIYVDMLAALNLAERPNLNKSNTTPRRHWSPVVREWRNAWKVSRSKSCGNAYVFSATCPIVNRDTHDERICEISRFAIWWISIRIRPQRNSVPWVSKDTIFFPSTRRCSKLDCPIQLKDKNDIYVNSVFA